MSTARGPSGHNLVCFIELYWCRAISLWVGSPHSMIATSECLKWVFPILLQGEYILRSMFFELSFRISSEMLTKCLRFRKCQSEIANCRTILFHHPQTNRALGSLCCVCLFSLSAPLTRQWASAGRGCVHFFYIQAFLGHSMSLACDRHSLNIYWMNVPMLYLCPRIGAKYLFGPFSF